MKCTITDPKECFNCPYSDCIAGDVDIKVQDATRVEKHGKKKPDWVAGRVNKKISRKETTNA